MIDIAQYISDLRETDVLGRSIEEFLSVCVIPVEAGQRAPIMATVKIKVLLPLDREVFATGTVIMHRPDGFLVQLDCSMNLEFLRQTLHEAIAAESGVKPAREPRKAAAPAAPTDVPPPARPEPAPRSAPLPEQAGQPKPAQNAPSIKAGGSTGRIQGNVNITERFEVPAKQAVEQADVTSAKEAMPPQAKPSRAARTATKPGARSETTASYFQKPDELRSDSMDGDHGGRQQEDLSISSISAVDSVTGQPIHSTPKPARHEKTTPGFSVDAGAMELEEEFSRKSRAGTGERTVMPPQEVTRRFFSPDVLQKARAESLKSPEMSGLVDGSAQVDELFSLAAEAGAIDIADSGLLEIPPERDKTSPGTRPVRDDPTNASSTMPGTIDVTRMIQERTKPRYRRPDDVLPDTDDDPDSGADRQQSQGAGGAAEQPAEKPAEPENREMAVRIREMTSAEKQKLARQGKRVARRILVRDNDKTIHKYVLFNPEIQLDEVIEYTRWNGLSAEAIEYITTNRQWMESRDVVYNIVKNPSTPTEIAVRLVIKLTPNDWRMFVRPGVVKPAVMNQARKLLFDTDKKS